MKKYKLKDNVKLAILSILAILTIIFVTIIGIDRVQKINDGTFIVIDHNAGDR